MSAIFRFRRIATLTALLMAAAVLLTLMRTPVANADPVGDGLVVFTRDVSGDGTDWDLILLDRATGQETVLTSGAGKDHSAAFSPDGQTVAFTRDDADGIGEIYTIGVDGTGLTNLTGDAADDDAPAWSGDGTQLAFASDRGGSRVIHTMNADGSGVVAVTAPGAGEEDFAPHWSPVDDVIIFSRQLATKTNIFMIDLSVGVANEFIDSLTDGKVSRSAKFSPDGQKVVYASNTAGVDDADYDIYVVGVDGLGQIQLTTDDAFDGFPRWAPSGLRVLFTSFRNATDDDVYVTPATGGSATRVTDHANDEFLADWQPLPGVAPVPLNACEEDPANATVWQGADGAYWGTDANWTNGVPSTTQTACLTGAGTYTVAYSGQRTVNGLVIADGVTLVMRGDVNNANSDLTVTGDITNGGAILLDAAAGNTSITARLTVGGVFTNRGTVLADGNGDSARRLTGDIVNEGEIIANRPVTLSGAGATYLNQGKWISRAHGFAFTGTGGTHSFTQESGELVVEDGAYFTQTSGVFDYVGGSVTNGNGGSVSPAYAPGLYDVAMRFTGPFDGSEIGMLRAVGLAGTLAGELPAGVTLLMEGNNTVNANSTVTLAAPVTNGGTILLDDADGNTSITAHLVIPDGMTLTNTGTIGSQGLGTSARRISGNVVNDVAGTIVVHQPLTLGKAGATYVNRGVVQVTVDKTLTVSGGSQAFAQEDGAIQLDLGAGAVLTGKFIQIDGAFAYSGGMVASGLVADEGATLRNVDLSFGDVPVDDVANFRLPGLSGATLSGNVPAGTTLLYKGDTGVPNANTTLDGPVTNHGTIILDANSGNASITAIINVPDGTALTNVGVLRADGFGILPRYVRGSLVNEADGLIDVIDPLYVDAAGASVNRGTIQVAPGSSIALSAGHGFTQESGSIDLLTAESMHGAFLQTGGAFAYDGGNIAAGHTPVTGAALTDVAVTFGAVDPLDVANIRLEGLAGTLTGDVPAGTALRLEGDAGTSNAVVTLTGSLTNHGVIQVSVRPQNTSTVGRLDAADGAVLSNNGLIEGVGGGTSDRIVRVRVHNLAEGEIKATDNMVFDEPGAAHTNEGLITVALRRQLRITGTGASLSNFAGQTLTGGAYDLAGNLRFPNADVRTNAAEIILRTGGNIVNDSGVNAMTSLGANAAGGYLEVAEGRAFTAPGSFSNAGTLTGTGTVTGDVTNVSGGRVALNGSLVIDGAFTQEAGGTLDVLIQNLEEYGTLAVLETATLGGAVDAELMGSVPANGDTFTVLVTEGGTSGDFGGSVIPVGDNGFGLAPLVGFNDVVLELRDIAAPVWADDAALTVGDTTHDSAVVSWPAATDNSAVTGYRVLATPVAPLEAGADAAEGAVQVQVGGDVTETTLTGLEHSTPYQVEVFAADAAANENQGLSDGLMTDGLSPHVTLAPEALTFASTTVGQTAATQTVTVTNTGTGPATLGEISTSGDFALAAPGSGAACAEDSALAADASCTIGVSFTPAVAGAREGELLVASDAGGSPHAVALSGTGAAAQQPGTGGGTPEPSPTTTPTPTPGAVDKEAGAGETVSTGEGVSQQDPVQTSVTTPTGGAVQVSTTDQADTPAPTGYQLMGMQVDITAPPAESAEDPLLLGFELHASLLNGLDASEVVVIRDGVELRIPEDDCVGSSVADPDPCVSVRENTANGVRIVVNSTHASVWNFAERLPSVVERWSGAGRAATAAQVSRHSFETGVGVAYIATSVGFADVLAGGPVAAANGAPILLTDPDSVPAETAAELDRLRPGSIVVLGGQAAVSQEVLTALAAHTTGTVSRIAGADRFATAGELARVGFPDGAEIVYVATGNGFPDALAGGALAASNGSPILLVNEGVPSATARELARLKPRSIVILGGAGVVSDAVARELGDSGTVTRLAGADRIATAVRISEEFTETGGTVFVATGGDFPDALAAVPAAAKLGAPLLLLPDDGVPANVAAALERLSPSRVVLLGGTQAVSEEAAVEMQRSTR